MARSEAYSETDRGRQAQSPSEIPSRGWKDILVRVKNEIVEDNLSMIAAGVAFYAFLAIFPAIAALVSIYGLVVDPASLQEHFRGIQTILPGDAAKLVNDELGRIVTSRNKQLGWSVVVGIGLALWSAATGMKAMFQSMNVAYDENEKRGFIRLNASALLMTFATIVFMILFIGLIVGIPALLATVPFGETLTALLKYARWPLLALAGILALSALYRYGPSREKPEWRWITWGAAIATIFWVAGSVLFSFYVTHFAGYNKTYGSLGVVVVMMMWLLLSVYCVLLGAEINAEMEHQTARDTTVGGEKPLGQRGAHVADTVGGRS
jgi:membrane protein